MTSICNGGDNAVGLSTLSQAKTTISYFPDSVENQEISTNFWA